MGFQGKILKWEGLWLQLAGHSHEQMPTPVMRKPKQLCDKTSMRGTETGHLYGIATSLLKRS